MKEDEETIQKAKKWLQDVANGVIGKEIEVAAIKGLKVVKADSGQFVCTFRIPHELADDSGIWTAGAIASLVDTVAAFTTASITGCENVTVDLTISYHSTARIHEEVEIEAKVAASKGRLLSSVVEVRRKDDGRIVALGKLWMNAANTDKVIPRKQDGKI